LFERVEAHPLKGAVVAQERVHLLGFVTEKEYTLGEIEEKAYFRPNPHLLKSVDAQRAAYSSFPLARRASAA
jgi:hypothetical protein